jgi:hypothetical protein
MNINFGLFPPLPETTGRRLGSADKRRALALRALSELGSWRLLEGIRTSSFKPAAETAVVRTS